MLEAWKALKWSPYMLSRLFRPVISRAMSTSASAPKQPAAVDGRSFRLALVQLGGCTPSKATNLERARDLVLKAAKGKDGDGAVDMIVLPECFNSLYGAGQSGFSVPAPTGQPETIHCTQQVNNADLLAHTEHFPTYAEAITGEMGEGGETTAMLHQLAKETNKWLIGGSMPERDSDGKLYNTS